MKNRRAFIFRLVTLILMAIIISDNTIAQVDHDNGLYTQFISEIDIECSTEFAGFEVPSFKPEVILHIYIHLKEVLEICLPIEIHWASNFSPHGWAVPIFIDQEEFRL